MYLLICPLPCSYDRCISNAATISTLPNYINSPDTMVRPSPPPKDKITKIMNLPTTVDTRYVNITVNTLQQSNYIIPLHKCRHIIQVLQEWWKLQTSIKDTSSWLVPSVITWSMHMEMENSGATIAVKKFHHCPRKLHHSLLHISWKFRILNRSNTA